MVTRLVTTIACLLALVIVENTNAQQTDPALTEVWENEPVVVTPGISASPPSDAIVLMADDLSAWTVWEERAKNSKPGEDAAWQIEDGVTTVVAKSGSIRTLQSFGSIQLHVEWRAPVMEGEGQGKGNSGIFLQQRYEIQILDSFQNRTYSNGQAGSVYKQHIPLVNASRPPQQWQTYDIVFTAPEFDADGLLQSPAYITLLHNGVLVQNHVALLGGTSFRGIPSYEAHGDAPLALQDHSDAVSFRNIWVRNLD